MKLKLIAGFIIGGLLAFGYLRIEALASENKRLSANQTVLLNQTSQLAEQNNMYKIADSINGIKTNELLLTISEYERYRAQDAELIAALTNKNANLEKVISAQAITINELSTHVVDSIVIYPDKPSDTLKCFDYKSKWLDIEGCLNISQNSITLSACNRESIKVVETIQYKRFLGFLWKTNKVENKQVDILSENPNTIIINSEVVTILQ